MLAIHLSSPVPIVEQIRSGIRRAIAAGELASGDALPTVRQLAADLGINLNTVARAYRQLEADGLVSTVRGRGTIVRSVREAPEVAERSVRERVTEAIRRLHSDARLAGMSRRQLEALFLKEARAMWAGE